MMLTADPIARLARTASPSEIAFEIQVFTGLSHSEAFRAYQNARDAISAPYAPDAYPDHSDHVAQQIVSHAIAATK